MWFVSCPNHFHLTTICYITGISVDRHVTQPFILFTDCTATDPTKKMLTTPNPAQNKHLQGENNEEIIQTDLSTSINPCSTVYHNILSSADAYGT